MEKTTKVRQSNLELLRIISMLMIVLSHYCTHNSSFAEQSLTIQSVMNSTLTVGGIGVVCFIMLFAWFSVDATVFKPKKIAMLWVACFVFSVGITAVFVCTSDHVGLKALLKACFPIGTQQWWFASAYIIFSFFTPYINAYIKTIEQKTHGRLVMLMFALWIGLPSLTSYSYGANDLLLFLFIYLLTAYIKRYPGTNEKRTGTVLMLLGQACILISVLFFQILGQYSLLFWGNALWLNTWNKFPNVMVAVGLFLIFKNSSIRQSKVINGLSSVTFYVYLFHDHPLIRRLLWLQIFNSVRYQTSGAYFLHMIISVVAVYTVSSLIGFVYRFTFEKLASYLSWLLEKIVKKYSKLARRFFVA